MLVTSVAEIRSWKCGMEYVFEWGLGETAESCGRSQADRDCIISLARIMRLTLGTVVNLLAARGFAYSSIQLVSERVDRLQSRNLWLDATRRGLDSGAIRMCYW